MQANPEVDAVIGQRLHFRHEPGNSIPERERTEKRIIDICLASAMFRRSLFAKFRGFDENLTFGEDLDFYMRLLEDDCLFLIETEAAVHYRLHDGNMTGDHLAMHRALLKAHHNSWVRRRAAGREGRSMFFLPQLRQRNVFRRPSGGRGNGKSRHSQSQHFGKRSRMTIGDTITPVPTPGVCVIVPVFNREDLIPYALQSLLAETGVELEVLVADDGSTDGTTALVASLAEKDLRIRLLRCNHRGPAAARNSCLRQAKREFVTFLDSDDLCAPGRLSRQISKLQANPEADVVIGHRVHFRDEPGVPFPEPTQIVNRNIDVCFASAMFRRSLFEELGEFDESLDYEDLDFYFKLLEQDRVFLVEIEPAVYHRRHGGNMTNDALRLQRGLLRAQRNSIARRRAQGRRDPLDVFFFRTFEAETLVGGKCAANTRAPLEKVSAR